eukprot:6200972-Pleurochrysis_carterae.AAC.1
MFARQASTGANSVFVSHPVYSASLVRFFALSRFSSLRFAALRAFLIQCATVHSVHAVYAVARKRMRVRVVCG